MPVTVSRAHYTDIRNDQGIWTAHQIDMHDLKRNSHTILKIEKLQYNLPMKDESSLAKNSAAQATSRGTCAQRHLQTTRRGSR